VSHKATRFLKNLVEKESVSLYMDVLQAAGAKDKEGNHKASIFWSKLGEILGSPSLTMYLSANPCDILTASYNGGFSSCLRPDGEFFSSVASYAHDTFTTICYIGTPARKFGRAFVYFNDPTFKSFLFSNEYGSFPTFMRDIGRHTIENKLAQSLGIENRWFVGMSELCSDSYADGMVYFDGDDCESIKHETVKDDGVERPDFLEPACVVCHTSDVASRRAVSCNDHGGRVECCCSGCGDDVNDDDCYRNDDGEPYCECCFYNRYFYCNHCDEISDAGDQVHTTTGESVCRYCAENSYATCDRCGGVGDQDDAVEESGTGALFCESCASYKGLVACDDCGLVSNECTDVDDHDKIVCPDCADNYLTCCECSKLSTSRNMNTGSGMCDECHTEAHDTCAECMTEFKSDDLNANCTCDECQAALDKEAV
jgi:hypothetical protein